MDSKSSKLLAIILILVTSALFISGCGKSGTRFANVLPTISITSYEGWDGGQSAIGADTLTIAFQQKIFWHATDPDGVITGYAFRVLDENRNPISTPDYTIISTEDDGLTPQALLTAHGPKHGWAVHYLPGADQSIPLNDARARRSVWTSQKYATISFPAADEQGNPTPTISYFEVVAIDNRGAITAQAAWRRFKTSSPAPRCTITTSKGNPAGGDVGSGIKLRFSMLDTDQFIPEIPHRFEFKVMKVDTLGVVIPGTETNWISTDSQPDINEYLLTRYTSPALTYDFNETTMLPLPQRTRILARVYDKAGVLSPIADSLGQILESSKLDFRVKPGFRPKTTFYNREQKVLALGEHHYVNNNINNEVLPYSIVQGAQRFATSPFRDFDGTRTMVYSNNLKFFIRWGWWGEYAFTNTAGLVQHIDDPDNKKVDDVLDRVTNKTYYSEITHYDLRYDGEPYNFPPFANSIKVDTDGKRWLRIPVTSPLGQTVVLTGDQVAPGNHTFEVRCVDSQDEVDPIPAVMSFYVAPYVVPANREGILVIDDSTNHPSNSPEAIVDAKYDAMFAGRTDFVTKDYVSLVSDARARRISLSELVKYKLVVYHSDNPSEKGSLSVEPDAFALYLIKGGNLVISHTQQLPQVLSEISKGGIRTIMLGNMGLPNVPDLGFLSSSLANNSFFHQANGAQGFPNVKLQIEFQAGDTPSFNPTVNLRKGLSAVSWFNSNLATPIYTLGCKPTTFPTSPPSTTQFDLYNGKTVGIRNNTASGGKVYTFGFPLSYMNDADAHALMTKIIQETM